MAIWEGSGLRVVELGSGISAAFAARLLADFGADVTKVETPGRGDEIAALEAAEIIARAPAREWSLANRSTSRRHWPPAGSSKSIRSTASG